MSIETKESYIEYVKSILNTLDPKECVTSYDTGFGMHITDTHLGESVSTMDVLQHSLAKIKPPRIDDTDAWDSDSRCRC
jgi:hypothetical protein